MALLGNGGILELSREWPEPMALTLDAINGDTIALGNPDYWTGDRVLFAAADGLPLDINGDGYADCPEGHGIYYGSEWDLGPARIHVTAAGDNYYQASDAVDFYNTAATTGLTTQSSGYINVDALDRVKLYSTEIAAHNAIAGSLISLSKVKTSNLVFTRYSANSTYTSAVTAAANSIKPLTLPSASQPLADVITVPAGFGTISGDPDQRGWLIQCDLTDWAMDIDADNLDMTAIGETFGEHTKALVRGAGSLQFQVENKVVAGEQSSTTLLRLVLLTQQYCRSSAKFYLYKDRAAAADTIGGNAFYECTILLNKSKVNVRAGDLITGTADFVATGEIGLKFA
jgi:hypothetical protein